jgi:hypothetical protein
VHSQGKLSVNEWKVWGRVVCSVLCANGFVIIVAWIPLILHWPFTPAKSLQNIAREGACGAAADSTLQAILLAICLHAIRSNIFMKPRHGSWQRS